MKFSKFLWGIFAKIKITEATNRQVSSPTQVSRSASVIGDSIAHFHKNSNNPDEILKIPLGYLLKNKK
jgi:hypothetical protein